MADWSSTKAMRSSIAPGNRCWGRLVTPDAARFKTPGLNLSRYERPLAERRLLGGAARDKWEPGNRLPLRRSTYDARPREWCGIMEVSLAET